MSGTNAGNETSERVRDETIKNNQNIAETDTAIKESNIALNETLAINQMQEKFAQFTTQKAAQTFGQTVDTWLRIS